MIDLPRPSLDALDLAERIYLEREPRDVHYRMARQAIAAYNGDVGQITPAEAIAALLLVWNVDYYRTRPAEKRSLVADLDDLLARHGDALARYRARTIVELTADDRDAITEIFADFRERLGPTGASKAVHLMAPQCLPMWDRTIRAEGYNVVHGSAAEYWSFIEITKAQVQHFGGVPPEVEPVRRLDQYNYVRFYLKAPEFRDEDPPALGRGPSRA